MKGIFITLGVVVLLGAMFAFWAIGVSNSEKNLRTTIEATQLSSELTFDKTWKVISDQAQNVANYKEDFRQIYTELMDARYENDKGAGQETLMKWVTENNVPLDAGLYGTLMNTIEGNRGEFLIQQKLLVDKDREHKRLRVIFPNSIIIGNRPDVGIKLVTSTKTEEAFNTGLDNSTPLKRD